LRKAFRKSAFWIVLDSSGVFSRFVSGETELVEITGKSVRNCPELSRKHMNATTRTQPPTPTQAPPDAGPFVVVLRAEGAGPPVAIRLRRWLKTALRAHGLRCVRIVEGSASEQGLTLVNDSTPGRTSQGVKS
jgi:hypothetical protein